jgi:hypothetical protein
MLIEYKDRLTNLFYTILPNHEEYDFVQIERDALINDLCIVDTMFYHVENGNVDEEIIQVFEKQLKTLLSKFINRGPKFLVANLSRENSFGCTYLTLQTPIPITFGKILHTVGADISGVRQLLDTYRLFTSAAICDLGDKDVR